MKFQILLFVFLAISIQYAHPAKILSVAFMSSRSHKITYDTLLEELVKRGHEVTVAAPYISGKKLQNLREHKLIDFDEFVEKSGMPNFFELKDKGGSLNPFTMIEPFRYLCRESYKLPIIQELMKEKFDLVITPAIFMECASGFLHRLNTTLIIVSPISVFPWISGALGSPTPASYNPTVFLEYGQDMNFFQRTVNIAAISAMSVMMNYFMTPDMEQIYRDALGDPTLPSSDEVIKNASLIISNSHFSISPIRPFLPSVVEVGGMHCHPPNPLPKDLETFVQGSGDDGFILFSMGSALKGSKMPDKYRKIFLNTFGKLKQKVLWKWETETMEGLPSNVKLSKWLPQQDVLGHSKIKLFITHGGMGSTTEAIYHGVPLLGIPMFADQIPNMRKNVEMGYALSIEFADLTEEKLTEGIQELLKNPVYSEKVKGLSKIFQDQPDKPLDRAVFWTEYVLRHKGALHLQSPARDLNFAQYYSLDVIAFLLAIIFLVLFIFCKIIALILGKIMSFFTGKKSVPIKNGKKRN